MRPRLLSGFSDGTEAGTGTPPSSRPTPMCLIFPGSKNLQETSEGVASRTGEKQSKGERKPAETRPHPLLPGPLETPLSIWPYWGCLKELGSAPPWQKPSPLHALFLCCDRFCSDAFGTQLPKKKTDHPSLGNYRATERPFSYCVISNRLF